MVYLDILIGFSLIMLVFASGVSVAQSIVKRFLSMKGRAIVDPLLDEMGRGWEASAMAKLDPNMWKRMRASLRDSFHSRRGGIGGLLHFISVDSPAAIMGMVRSHGQSQMQSMMTGAEGALLPNYQAEWDRLVGRVTDNWDAIVGKLSATYERHVRFSVYTISLAAALLFNVDAVRILRVLSVSGETRKALTEMAEKQHTEPSQGGAPALPATLTDWQKQNFAELSGTGLPLGWERAPLLVCKPGGARASATTEGGCGGESDVGESIWLWLVRLFGLVVGAGLIGQGAPFGYSLLDSVLGLKKKVGGAGEADKQEVSAALSSLTRAAGRDAGSGRQAAPKDKDKAAAGGEED